MRTDHDLDTLTDAVNELTRSHIHREPYSVRTDSGWEQRTHSTDAGSLIDQLEQALEPGGTGDAGRTVPGSRPSARLEAIDTLMAIDQASYVWCKTYDEDRRWDSISHKLRALVGVATRLDSDTLHELAVEARRWATAARVCTGWEVPPFRPNSTCPLCAVRGGLRVRVGDGINSASACAYCVNCGEAWDDSNVGLLAEHIRAENGDTSLYEDGAA